MAPGSRTTAAGSALPTGWSPTSTEQASRTGAASGWRVVSSSRRAASVVAPSTATSSVACPTAARAAAQ